MIRKLFPDKDIYIIQYDGSQESFKAIGDMCKMASKDNLSYLAEVIIKEGETNANFSLWIRMKNEDGRMNICVNPGEYILIDLDANWNLKFIVRTTADIKDEFDINIESKEITLAAFQAAKQTIIDFYGQDFKKINGNDRPCICCSNMIKPEHPETTRFPQSGMYNGGVVDKISAGYGSNVDGDMYIIAICDGCIKRLKDENKIQFAGNYMNMY